jgi:hypothetical protein
MTTLPKWKEKKNNSWDFCRRGMDTPRKKPRRNIRGSSAAIGTPLQVKKLNEIGIQKNRSALCYRIKGGLTPFYFFRKRSIMDKHCCPK